MSDVQTSQNQNQSGVIGQQEQAGEALQGSKHTFICSRDTLEGAYPPIILGINSKRLGYDSHVFFTFMGLNMVRKDGAEKAKFHPPGFLGAIPGMSWLATRMMKKKIADINIPEVPDLLEMAQLEGVRLVACHMTMDMMGLTEDDLIEGVEVMNAEDYVKLATECDINMFT